MKILRYQSRYRNLALTFQRDTSCQLAQRTRDRSTILFHLVIVLNLSSFCELVINFTRKMIGTKKVGNLVRSILCLKKKFVCPLICEILLEIRFWGLEVHARGMGCAIFDMIFFGFTIKNFQKLNV